MSEKRFLLFFFLANLALSSFYLDSWRNPNTTSRVLQVRSLHEDQVLHIDKFHEETIDISFVNEHYYPDKAPFPSLVVYPIYSLLCKAGIAPEPIDDNGEYIFLLGSFLTGSLCFTLIILLIYQRLVAASFDRKTAALISSLPLYGSMFFIYAGTFYAHLMVVLFLIVSLKMIEEKKYLLIAGFFSGAAFFSEYITAIFCFVWFFQTWKKQSFKQAFIYGLGIFPFILAFMWYNLAVTGNALKTAYAYQVYYDLQNGGFSWPSISAMFQMLFSPWRGIFIHTTIFIAFIPLLIPLKNFNIPAFLKDYVLLPSLIFFIVLSSFEPWSGGWAYGTRYLFPALGILLYSYLPILQYSGSKRLWIALPIAIGLIHAFTAKFTWQYSIQSDYTFPFFQKLLPSLFNGNCNDNGMLTRWFDISPLASAFLFIGLFTLLMLIFNRTEKRVA